MPNLQIPVLLEGREVMARLIRFVGARRHESGLFLEDCFAIELPDGREARAVRRQDGDHRPTVILVDRLIGQKGGR